MLAILPEDLALDVVGRMLKMEAVQKEVIERVEQTLRTEFVQPVETRRRDAHEVMAEIFNTTARPRPASSPRWRRKPRIRRAHQGADVYLRRPRQLDPPAQTLMRNVDKDKLGIALKSANEEVRSNIAAHVLPRRQDADGRHGGDGTGAAARRRRGAGAARQPRQGHGRRRVKSR